MYTLGTDILRNASTAFSRECLFNSCIYDDDDDDDDHDDKYNSKERKGKEEYLYSAFLHQVTHKALRHGSHSFTCKQRHACLSFVNVHQMAPPQQLRQQTSNCSLLLIDPEG